MTTHAIVLGGILKDAQGRPLGPYRLRTACREAGYNCHVIDFAWALNTEKLLTICESVISEDTLVLGISNVWFSSNKGMKDPNLNAWFSDTFFHEFHRRWPWIEIVIGGTKMSLVQGSKELKKYTKWWLTGFGDIGFVELLKYLQGKITDLKFTVDSEGCHIIDCNEHYRVVRMDDLETVFEKGDDFKPYQPISLEVSRGCIFTCSFCSHPFLGKKHDEYIRSSESLARELRRNYDLFGTTRYQIMDDTFNDSMEKLERLERAIELSKIPQFEFCGYIRAELIATKPEMIPKLRQLGIRGGTIGLESLNPEARRAIGKGMDIERVFDALANFKANSRVLLHTGMIVGLPGDTVEDAYSWVERFKRDKLLDVWTFNGLGLTHDKEGKGVSVFDRDPEKWGYEILGYNPDSWTIRWRNNRGMIEQEATRAAEAINEEAVKINTAGGFSVGSYWFAGASDQDLETITHWNMALGHKGSVSGRVRANKKVEEAQAILNTRKNTP